MNALDAFTLPISGLKVGTHQFDFQLDKSFFDEYEAAPVKAGNVQVSVELDKRADMMVFRFEVKGTIATQCDRCLADIDLPIEGTHDLIVKYLPAEGNPEPELIYIDRAATQLKLANHLYEFTCLTIPMIKVYDCQVDDPIPCNEELLDILDGEAGTDSVPDNPIWDVLKDLKK